MPTKEELQEEMEFQQKMILQLVGCRRELELQMAKFGSLFVPPYITQEITELTNQIDLRHQELAKLKTQVVEGELPLAEVEYRVLVAEAWSTSSGWLCAVDEARLELSRLRLGITQDGSGQHHDIVRQRLAAETLLDLELNDIQGAPETRARAVQRIIHAFRFDPTKTEEMLDLNIDLKSTEILAEWINTTRTVWQSKDEYHDLNSLFQRLLLKRLLGEWQGQYTYGNDGRTIPMHLHIDQISHTQLSGRAE